MKHVNVSLEDYAKFLKADITTKKDFVDDHLSWDALFDFLTYEVYEGDSEKAYEKLCEHFHDDYDAYCENIIETWYTGENNDRAWVYRGKGKGIWWEIS